MASTRGIVSVWLDRPLGRGWTIAMGALVVIASAWLFADGVGWFYFFDPFGSYVLVMDDFPYVAESRSLESLRAHLWQPHNAHVVPLFRLWIYGLCRVAGSLAHLPAVLGFAAFLALALVMIAGGLFVARETGNSAMGLATMALLGVTSVMEPVVAWFAAGQTLWAGLFVLLTLLALQSWAAHGRLWRLILAIVAIVAAPLFWSGGLIAGPVGAAYVFCKCGAKRRPAMTALVLISLTVGGALLLIGRSANHAAMSDAPVVRPIYFYRGLVFTFQGITEALVMNNLGLDTKTTPTQAVVLCFGLLVTWCWTRIGHGPIQPLEAAGAFIVLLAFGMTYTFRGKEDYYDSLRNLRWYHAIPQIGAALFAAGWFNACFRVRPGALKGTAARRQDGLYVLALVALLLTLQLPRVQRLFFSRIPPLTAYESTRFPVPWLERLRNIFVATEAAVYQHDGLAALDAAQATARRTHISRAAIHRALGSVTVKGWPSTVKDKDALDLLDLPQDGPDGASGAMNQIRELVRPKPEPRPQWLPNDETWPPATQREEL
jgi:hypothetical protein